MAILNPTSLLDVFMNLREFFADLMNRPPTSLLFGTNVRTDGNFTDAAWNQLAGEICQLNWAQSHRVTLPPATMNALSTLSDLTYVIWDEINDTAPAMMRMSAKARTIRSRSPRTKTTKGRSPRASTKRRSPRAKS